MKHTLIIPLADLPAVHESFWRNVVQIRIVGSLWWKRAHIVYTVA